MWRTNANGLPFLVIYLMVTFRFLAPVVHYQLNYDYMATVQCVNRDKPIAMCFGKCELKKELRQLHAGTRDNNALLQLVHSLQLVEALPALALALQAPALPLRQPLPATNTSKQLYGSPSPLFHPPQV
ncbi:hypothetical protein [Pontibacter liquoris]|uniref:hypothetical protein n=1 Tax=Pontibacter liquoris TaxID=2905677 RepID=UPI001FA72381|nr:hypothetical protein [Pontibacter liquoris]